MKGSKTYLLEIQMKGSKTYLLEKGIEGTLEEKTERTLVLKDSRNRFRRPSIAQV